MITNGNLTPSLEVLLVTGESQQKPCRYSTSSLGLTLQVMGCKPRAAHRAAQRVFRIAQQRATLPSTEECSLTSSVRSLTNGSAGVYIPRGDFETLVMECVKQTSKSDTNSLDSVLDLRTACNLNEKKTCITIVLCGTSGTGKSTLASLLAARLGITTILSTDTVRHMLRSFTEEQQDPLLWVSTYEAGETLQSMVVQSQQASPPPWDSKKFAIRGYKAQSEAVVHRIEHLIAKFEIRNESSIIEGVHLSPGFITKMMGSHPSIIPFLVHISNESKHMERFAIRSKSMTLRADGNRYVKNLRSIRVIQDYLVKSADKRAVPKVDNTNVDKTVATIHATVLKCLHRREGGEQLIDARSRRCDVILEEYLQCKSATWSGRDMLELIRNRRAAKEDGGVDDSDSDGPSTSTAGRSERDGITMDDNDASFVESQSQTSEEQEEDGAQEYRGRFDKRAMGSVIDSEGDGFDV